MTMRRKPGRCRSTCEVTDGRGDSGRIRCTLERGHGISHFAVGIAWPNRRKRGERKRK